MCRSKGEQTIVSHSKVKYFFIYCILLVTHFFTFFKLNLAPYLTHTAHFLDWNDRDSPLCFLLC